MRLSAKSRYAVTAMVDLAVFAGSRPVSLADIADRHHMPLPYLEQLFVKLRRKGLVQSARGFQGGFTLGRPGGDISLLDVLYAVDDAIKTTGCGVDSVHTTCNGTSAKCMTHNVWEKLGDHVRHFFRATSLLDILPPQSVQFPEELTSSLGCENLVQGCLAKGVCSA